MANTGDSEDAAFNYLVTQRLSGATWILLAYRSFWETMAYLAMFVRFLRVNYVTKISTAFIRG